GIGYKLLTVGNKGTILLINLIGRTFLNERLDDPFTKADEILSLYESNKPDYIIVDFHAESSSEKHALGFYLDGRVNAVVGSHTHVPTCDARVFPKGTLYVTDIGMTGNIDSVLGVKKEIILKLYLTGLNQRFEWEYSGRNAFRSVILDMKQNKIERLDLEI
ncbi:MAG: Metallophosphoesterase, partial [uncultured bacterium]